MSLNTSLGTLAQPYLHTTSGDTPLLSSTRRPADAESPHRPAIVQVPSWQFTNFFRIRRLTILGKPRRPAAFRTRLRRLADVQTHTGVPQHLLACAVSPTSPLNHGALPDLAQPPTLSAPCCNPPHSGDSPFTISAQLAIRCVRLGLAQLFLALVNDNTCGGRQKSNHGGNHLHVNQSERNSSVRNDH